ncbi:hypothetical protein ACVXHB_28900 [Escherichia coli]
MTTAGLPIRLFTAEADPVADRHRRRQRAGDHPTFSTEGNYRAMVLRSLLHALCCATAARSWGLKTAVTGKSPWRTQHRLTGCETGEQMMNEQEDIKTAAELEAEARERARAEIDGDKPAAGAVPPGQPQAAQHAKRRSRRSLVLAAISLVLLVIIATGGDYLMAKLKGDGSGRKREP